MTPARRLPALAAVIVTAALACAGVTIAGTANAAPSATPTPAPSKLTGPDTTGQQKTTFSVQPSTASGPTTRTSWDYTVVAGSDIVDYAGVNNYSNKPVTLELYATDAFNTPNGATDALAGAEQPEDVGSWVKFPKRRYVVPANSRVDVPFRIDVPSNATPGDHVGAVIASLKAVTDDGKGGKVTVDRRVGSRINLRVEGDLEPVLTVKNLKTSYSNSVNPLGGTLTLTYDVANTGNVQLQARQLVEVKALGLIGVKKSNLPDLDKVLPGFTVTRTEKITGVPAGFFLSTKLTLEPFTASDDLGETPPSTSAKDSTIAIPWALLALILILVVGALLWRRTRKGRNAKRAAEIAAAVEAAKQEVRAERGATTEDAATTEDPVRPTDAG